ncbi:MAG TPA: response regulator [Aestuariivirga sp.]|nr:response regulator [Aestuariivirga sp.]
MNALKQDQLKLKVLVVEDEAIIAMMLEDMLTDLGHEVAATAGRLDQAMKLVAIQLFDFAILDVNLNGEETYPLAARLKELGVPFIFSTGYGATGLNKEWRAVPLLQKPFEVQSLADAISRLAIPGGDKRDQSLAHFPDS